MLKGAMRFQPDPLDYALIDFGERTKTFTATHIALITNESFTGSGLLIYTPDTILEGTDVRVKIGRMGPLDAKIVWVKKLDDNILKVGVQYDDHEDQKKSGGEPPSGSYAR